MNGAFQYARLLHQFGKLLTRDTAYQLLEQCTKNKDLEACRHVHTLMICSGLTSLAILGDHVIRLLGTSGDLLEANLVFSMVVEPSAHTWQALISVYAKHEKFPEACFLFQKMQEEGIKPTSAVLLSILKVCSNGQVIGFGRLIHSQIAKCGIELDLVVSSALVDMYSKSGNVEEAQKVFDDLQHKDVILWNTMIAAYAQHGDGQSALQIFEKMQEEIKPQKATFPSVLKACGITKDLKKGREIHSQINSSGFAADVVVGSAVIDMYVRCGSLKEAYEAFMTMPTHNLISWNIMISAYAQQGYIDSAFSFFLRMQLSGEEPDRVTLLGILKACSGLDSIDQGRLIHSYITRRGLKLDVLGTSLIDFYAGFGNLEDARSLFDSLPIRSVASWGAIIEGYLEQGDGLSALELFSKMQSDNIEMDKAILLSTLKACGISGASSQGMLLHDQVIRCGLETDVLFGTMLIDMYAKCGILNEALRVFINFPGKDVVSWGALVAAYAQHGHLQSARQCLEGMQKQGLIPDTGIYTNMLTACSHACEVEVGLYCFENMKKYGISPGIEHYNSMIVLLSHAGYLSEAGDLLQSIPISPYTTGWTTLLAACRIHGNLELGRKFFDHVVELDPTVASGYMLMSNMYTDSHMWEDAGKLQDLRKCASAWKKPGGACIEVNEKTHSFVVDSLNHSQSDNVFQKLKGLRLSIKQEGYVPDSALTVNDVVNCEDDEFDEFMGKQTVAL